MGSTCWYQVVFLFEFSAGNSFHYCPYRLQMRRVSAMFMLIFLSAVGGAFGRPLGGILRPRQDHFYVIFPSNSKRYRGSISRKYW